MNNTSLLKKVLLSAGFILVSAAYVVSQLLGSGQPAAVADTASPTQTTTPTPTPVQKTGQYTDGTYTGVAVDAFYGLVQVKATVQGGALTDVTFLQYPNDRSTSHMINNQAMPILKSEAIQAQSANVDIVSGATDTSQAFQQSLSSALAKAS